MRARTGLVRRLEAAQEVLIHRAAPGLYDDRQPRTQADPRAQARREFERLFNPQITQMARMTEADGWDG